MEESQAADLARELVEAVNRRDTDRAIALMDPEVVFTPLVVQSGAIAEPFRGLDEVRGYLESFSGFWGDGQMRLRGVHAVADVIVAFCDAVVPGAGEPLAVTYICRVRGGRLLEMAAFADLEKVREALTGRVSRTTPRPLDVTFPAVRSSVPVARQVLRAFLEAIGASDELSGHVALAATEAISNVVLHAYRDSDELGFVRVGASMGDSRLTVTVSDEGCGLKPRPDSPGLGLGISLMTHQAAELTFVVPPQRPVGTEVRMCFELAA